MKKHHALTLNIGTFVLASISLIPSFFYVTLQLTSLTLGFIISIVLSLMVFAMNNKSKVHVNNIVISVLLTLLILFISSFSPYGVAWKMVSGIILLALTLSLAVLMSNYIKRLSDVKFKNIVVGFSRVLLILGLSSLLIKLNVLNYSVFSKSIFTFYEPSHYATVLGSLLISYLLMVEKVERNIALLFVVMISFITPSLTLLIYLIIFFLVKNKNILYSILLCMFFIVCLYFIVMMVPDLNTYFTSRLFFSDDNNNISALVYLQGWAEAYKIFNDGYYFGLGFNMSGANEPSGIAERVYKIVGIYKNRDGSFIASKLIVDFGLIGLLVVCLYLSSLFKAFLLIKKISNNKDLFVNSIILSFSVEMFVRSNSYFTFGLFLLFTALFFILETSIFKTRSKL